jgi:hypothetical protein
LILGFWKRLHVMKNIDVDLEGLYRVDKTCGLVFVKSFFSKIVNEGRINATKYYFETLV